MNAQVSYHIRELTFKLVIGVTKPASAKSCTGYRYTKCSGNKSRYRRVGNGADVEVTQGGRGLGCIPLPQADRAL